MRPSIEIRDECPYCGYRFSIDARDITGELHALRCLDCKEKFVVEIVVTVSHTIDGIAGVEPDGVLDRLSGVDPRKAEAGDLNSDEPDDRKMTDDELAELRSLLTEDHDADPEFVAPDAFSNCEQCQTRTFCRNTGQCTREHPAEARSGINTGPRARPADRTGNGYHRKPPPWRRYVGGPPLSQKAPDDD